MVKAKAFAGLVMETCLLQPVVPLTFHVIRLVCDHPVISWFEAFLRGLTNFGSHVLISIYLKAAHRATFTWWLPPSSEAYRSLGFAIARSLFTSTLIFPPPYFEVSSPVRPRPFFVQRHSLKSRIAFFGIPPSSDNSRLYQRC